MDTFRPVSTSSHCEVGCRVRRCVVLLLLVGSGAAGQTICDSKQKGTIACLVPNVIETAAHNLDPNFPFDPNVATGDALLLVPLASSLPIPSPASGFVYSFDASTGAYIRTSQTFGPILAERAETIGRNKASIGFTFQRFVFDKVDGVELHDVTTVLRVGQQGLISSADTVITNHLNLGVELNQFTVFAAYGITNRLDVLLAVPISTAYLGISYNGTVQSAATGGLPIPFSASVRETASGFGDVNFQIKGTVVRSEHAGIALGANLRLPTGNEYQGLGAGAAGIEPFVVASVTYKRVTPHLNFGYRWNGQSVLEGNPETGVKSRIPSQMPYALGADIGVAKRVTLALDILGLEVIHGDRFTTNITNGLERSSYNIANGSAGFKFNPFGNILVVANVLFPLNDGGLRSKVVPMIGLSYAF